MLDHIGSGLFFGTGTTKNRIVCGVDAPNVFAEASAYPYLFKLTHNKFMNNISNI